ncbi:MAG: hypothetical protein PHX18_02370 [Candidatus Gastranaerophilales bacterium]|nr:hypothetical protein [Candidatus Gastranaerophilales bacterium]
MSSEQEQIQPKEYIFKLKKGEYEIELKSTDEAFIQEQMDIWRKQMLR